LNKRIKNSEVNDYLSEMPKLLNDNKYDLEERLIDFAVSIINFVESLPVTKSANHLFKCSSFTIKTGLLLNLTLPLSPGLLAALS